MQVGPFITRCVLTLGALGALGCDPPPAPKPPAATPKASVSPTPTPAERVQDAMVEDAKLNAQVLIERAKLKSFRKAMIALKHELQTRDQEKSAPMADDLGAPTVTLLFSSNNHGELEDCGCVSRPLGGLARRATLFDAVTSGKKVQKLWGQEAPKLVHATFRVDAGEGLTRSPSVAIDKPAVRARNKRNALAVIEAMNQSPPDAMGVGERELLLGKEALLEFQAKSTFPLISANLSDSETGKLMLPGSVKVERKGQGVVIIGLTNPRSRFGDFHSARKIKILDPFESYVKAVADAPKASTVVLLSNLGVAGTGDLVRRLKSKGHRVDAVVVSGSNSLTKTPRWSAGVPMVEPLSRGKYVGRLDLYVIDSMAGWSFANTGDSVGDVLVEYSRTMQAYLGTRAAQLQDQQELLYMKLVALKRMAAAPNPDQPVKAFYSVRNTQKTKMLSERQKMVQGRIDLHSSAMLSAVRALNATKAPEGASKGLDVAQALLLAVELKIPEDKGVVRVLKPYADLKTPLPEQE